MFHEKIEQLELGIGNIVIEMQNVNSFIFNCLIQS